MTDLAPPLRQVQVLLTERCNLACTHCAVPEEDSPADGELDTDTWLAFIRRAVEGGVDTIVLSGGEALLRRDALSIASGAFEAGAQSVVIVINGTVMPPRVARDIAALQQEGYRLKVHVSIDGADAVAHDLIRGTGTFDRTMAGLGRLRSGGGKVNGVHSVLGRHNVSQLEALATLVRSIGASTWTVFPIASLGRGTQLDSLRLGQPEWEVALDLLPNIAGTDIELALMGPTLDDEWCDRSHAPRPRREHSPQVCAGPDGALFTCPPLRSASAANVGTCTTAADWADAADTMRRLLAEECPACKYRSLCTGIEPSAPRVEIPTPLPGSRLQPHVEPVALLPTRRQAPSTS